MRRLALAALLAVSAGCYRPTFQIDRFADSVMTTNLPPPCVCAEPVAVRPSGVVGPR